MPSSPPHELARLVAALRTEPWDHRRAAARLDRAILGASQRQLNLFDSARQGAQPPASIEQAQELLKEWRKNGHRFLPASDPDYPVNLRRFAEHPAFIFTLGQPWPEDQYSVAVVGTRSCSEAGRRRATKLGRELAEHGFTVLSGLALGIDTAAHQGALAAKEGRTIAVVGTGLQTIYPPENRNLQETISERGAIISPFWPEFTGTKGGANFLLRNQIISDLSLATVVVEASFRSGARSQAAYALRSGNRVFLLRSLVRTEAWAQEMSRKPNTHVIGDIEELLRHLSRGISSTESETRDEIPI